MKFFKRNKSKNSPAEHVEQPAPVSAPPESAVVPQPPLQEAEPAPIEGTAVEETAVVPVRVAVPEIVPVELAQEVHQEVQKPEQPLPIEPSPTVPEAEANEAGLFSRLKRGLSRTSDSLFQGLGSLFLGAKEIDEELFEELESRLLMADVGVEATVEIIESLTKRVSRKELTRPEALQAALKEELLAMLKPCQVPLELGGKKPFVMLMVGVNGVGKTTTIGKLTKRFGNEGRSVMLAAGDTFRAAAVEQLQVWGERNAVPVIAQHTGADCASVIYDSVQAARSRGIDVLIADTAGRLHNKDHLMDELEKVVRVIAKLDESAPHEVMLVLDAGTGQNALAQASHFQKSVGVTGICLTKLDGTAKGGVIFAIAKKLGLPIRYIGVGEGVEDLRPFNAEQFIEALFAEGKLAG
jgi:fused signal recognition particle receptor